MIVCYYCGNLILGLFPRVAISDKRIDGRTFGNTEGIQVYVSFCSFFEENEIIFPTEMFLRKAFIMHGKLLDCSVKDYKFHQEQKVQEGYGFLTLASFEEAQKLATECRNITVDGITVTCSLTHHLKNGFRKPRTHGVGDISSHIIPPISNIHGAGSVPLPSEYSAHMHYPYALQAQQTVPHGSNLGDPRFSTYSHFPVSSPF